MRDIMAERNLQNVKPIFKDYRDYAIEKGITQWLEVKTC